MVGHLHSAILVVEDLSNGPGGIAIHAVPKCQPSFSAQIPLNSLLITLHGNFVPTSTSYTEGMNWLLTLASEMDRRAAGTVAIPEDPHTN